MFVISKVVWALVQPSSLMLIGVLVGLMFVARQNARRALPWLATSLAALIVSGFTGLSSLLIIPLENRFPRPDLTGARIDGIIMLGGAEDSAGYGRRELLAVNEAGERVIETLALAQRFPAARIVVSGGTGALIDRQRPPEAELTGRFLASMGVAQSRLVLETRSRTTDENARFSRDLIGQKPGERWLVVTSAWHMPRAIGCFRATGLTVEAWPVDYRTAGTFEWTVTHSSFTEGLRRLDLVFKEYAGLLAYRLTGRTSALFPG